MNRTETIAWVLRVVTDVRLSQAKTLAELVAAAVPAGRAVPLLWATSPEWVLPKSQNHLPR